MYVDYKLFICIKIQYSLLVLPVQSGAGTGTILKIENLLRFQQQRNRTTVRSIARETFVTLIMAIEYTGKCLKLPIMSHIIMSGICNIQ
jgi:hypothetical protein